MLRGFVDAIIHGEGTVREDERRAQSDSDDWTWPSMKHGSGREMDRDGTVTIWFEIETGRLVDS